VLVLFSLVPSLALVSLAWTAGPAEKLPQRSVRRFSSAGTPPGTASPPWFQTHSCGSLNAQTPQEIP
jgi:hypothetical protein